MSAQPDPVEEVACDDARATRKGSYSGWLKKAKSDNARFKMLQSSNTRYFTIDFDAQLLYYSSSAAQKKISQPIPFWDILGAESLPLPAKKKTKGQCGFLVKTRDRTFELHANTPADAAHWTSGLNAASDIGMASRSKEAVPDFPEEGRPTYFRSEERCRHSVAEMLPNSIEPADEDSEAADENEEEGEDENQRQRAEHEKEKDEELEGVAKALEEEERRRQAEAQEAIEMERRAKEEAEQRLQELQVMLKAKEAAEEADRKAREEAELRQEQEEQEQKQRLREEETQRAAQEEMDRKRRAEAMARDAEELERWRQEEEARQAQELESARRAQEAAARREVEEARKRAVEEALRAEEARQQEAERHAQELQRQAIEEQQKIIPRRQDNGAGDSYSDEFSKQDDCMDAADDCQAEIETVATALPSELSRETELDVLKSDVRDLMAEGLGFLEEALDFVLSMPMSGDDVTDDETGAEAWMNFLAQDVEQKPSFDEPAKSETKKSDKKTERTDEEREARRARKEEKRKLREEQKAKEEQSTAEADQHSAQAAEETVRAFQKKGLPALQPLKPLKKLTSLSTCAPSSAAGSLPVSGRSSAVESAAMQPCSWEAKAAVAPSGWDSDEARATPEQAQNEAPEGPATYATAQDAAPSGWDSDEEKTGVRGMDSSRRPSENNLKGHAREQEEMPLSFKVPEGPAPSGQEPSGWDDSDSEESGIEDARTEMRDSSAKGAVHISKKQVLSKTIDTCLPTEAPLPP